MSAPSDGSPAGSSNRDGEFSGASPKNRREKKKSVQDVKKLSTLDEIFQADAEEEERLQQQRRQRTEEAIRAKFDVLVEANKQNKEKREAAEARVIELEKALKEANKEKNAANKKAEGLQQHNEQLRKQIRDREAEIQSSFSAILNNRQSPIRLVESSIAIEDTDVSEPQVKRRKEDEDNTMETDVIMDALEDPPVDDVDMTAAEQQEIVPTGSETMPDGVQKELPSKSKKLAKDAEDGNREKTQPVGVHKLPTSESKKLAKKAQDGNREKTQPVHSTARTTAKEGEREDADEILADAKLDMDLEEPRNSADTDSAHSKDDDGSILCDLPYLGENEILSVLSDYFESDASGNFVVKSRELNEDAAHDPSESDDSNQSVIQSHAECPPPPSFIAPLRVSLDISAEVLIDQAHKRKKNPTVFKEIYHEKAAPPTPPAKPTTIVTDLHPRVRRFEITSKKQAHSKELRDACLSSPIAVVGGLAKSLKFNVDLFSSSSLAEASPTLKVNVLRQSTMAEPSSWEIRNDENRRYSTLQTQANKQKEHLEQSTICEENVKKYVSKKKQSEDESKARSFATNIDLVGGGFDPHYEEVQKLPDFIRPHAPHCNFLDHVDQYLLGLNTMQLYLKVPGNRTPGHLESNSMASINYNVGPSSCKWSGVEYKYWGEIARKCEEEKRIPFLTGSWWPDTEELIRCGIPVYEFTQQPGDLVHVGLGFVHWVKSDGVCNNISWNTGPMMLEQIAIAVFHHEWNRFKRYKSNVPMQRMFWQLAKDHNSKQLAPLKDRKVHSLIHSMLIRSLSYLTMLIDWVERQTNKEIRQVTREYMESSVYCVACNVEVFNVIIRKVDNVYCVDCAKKMDDKLKGFLIKLHHPLEEFSRIYDTFRLNAPFNDQSEVAIAPI